MKLSPYFSYDSFIKTLSDKKEEFCVLSLNCQSLNAKFDNLLIILEELKCNNFYFGAICLQEAWLTEEADLTLFQIPGYHCIHQGRYTTQHGGLIIYLHEHYEYIKFPLMNKPVSWECQIINVKNVSNGKSMFICNSYSPPHDNLNSETVNSFINDINAIFCEINSQNSIKLLLGDFNIDFLKINQKSFIKDFLDNIFTLGLCPSITLPTRLTDTSATLIDNVFSNINFQSSGLLVSNLSDHFPYFYTIQTSHTVKNNAKKYIYYRKEDDNHIQKNL